MLEGGVTTVNPYSFKQYSFTNTKPPNDNVNDVIYTSDEFRMYGYKIKKCTRTRSHDWTECPYAHRGEKAQRRDPRKVSYTAIACPAFRSGGGCSNGDMCLFAHGIFEYWLHPGRYRTRACNSGRFCQRKVCFFAHTPDQLRSDETKSYNKCTFVYRARMNSGGVVEGGALSPVPVSPMMESNKGLDKDCCNADFLKSLSGLKIRDSDYDMGNGGGGVMDTAGFPNIDWISKLVK